MNKSTSNKMQSVNALNRPTGTNSNAQFSVRVVKVTGNFILYTLRNTELKCCKIYFYTPKLPN